MLLAHPLPEHTGLGLLPVGLALLGAVLVVGLGALIPGPRGVGAPEEALSERTDRRRRFRLPFGGSEAPVESWPGGLTGAQIGTRIFGVAVLLMAIAAGRIGPDFQPYISALGLVGNIAPPLIVGAAWPLLLLGSAILGPIWRWLDPWDGVARLGETEKEESQAGEDRLRALGQGVWSALVPAVAWAWYLSVYTGALDPRPLGAALAVYSLVTVAACIAFGRQLWLSRVEIFGLLFSWTARLPRGQLLSWVPPAGAEAVIGALAGGFLFGRLRLTSLWGELNVVPLATVYSTSAVLVCAAVGGAILWFLGRRSAQLGAVGAVAAATVPALLSISLAIAMARNRLTTSLQMLPGLASDPFGLGWDLFGTAGWGINPEPLGDVGLKIAQIAILVVGHVIGAIVLARRAPQPARAPALVALAAMLIPSVVGVGSTP